MKTMEASAKKAQLKVGNEKALREFVREAAVSLREGKQKVYSSEAVMAEMRGIIKRG